MNFSITFFPFFVKNKIKEFKNACIDTAYILLCLSALGSCCVSVSVGPGRSCSTPVIALQPGDCRNSTRRALRGAYLEKCNGYNSISISFICVFPIFKMISSCLSIQVSGIHNSTMRSVLHF